MMHTHHRETRLKRYHYRLIITILKSYNICLKRGRRFWEIVWMQVNAIQMNKECLPNAVLLKSLVGFSLKLMLYLRMFLTFWLYINTGSQVLKAIFVHLHAVCTIIEDNKNKCLIITIFFFFLFCIEYVVSINILVINSSSVFRGSCIFPYGFNEPDCWLLSNHFFFSVVWGLNCGKRF